MNCTHTNKLIPHQPSLNAISRVGLIVAYSRAGPAFRTNDSVNSASVLQAASAHHLALKSSGISKPIFKPRNPGYRATFHFCTLKLAEQQAALALTLDSPDIQVCAEVGRLSVSATQLDDRYALNSVQTTSSHSCTMLRILPAKEVQEAQKAGNARRLFQLILATSSRKPPVSETIRDQNGAIILNTDEQLDC
ncbi:hypothetical protein CLF_102294 [Clonorchis sinensis]|uniref:Uncharacterized protein n=1 Tax=Clonorchis sinensis TaxID=79923 RepID=G7YMZ5_CLOSI|nr:hypothetical protein CLF_102294 [Clonorchis sinensis]